MSTETPAPVEDPVQSQDANPATQEKRASDESGRTLVPGTINKEDVYTGWKLIVLLVSLGFGNFLGGMDFTVMATAIPIITSYFNSLDDVGWYGAAYYLAFCVGQPVAGKLYTFFAKKVVYLCYIACFAVGSLICGVAPTSNALIVGRAFSGLGASGMLAGGNTVVATICPLHKRPMFTGILNASFGSAQIIGPLVGGALAEKVTWRWCFYINLPISGVVALCILLVLSLKRAETQNIPMKQKLISLDLPGFVLLAGAIIMLLMALESGGTIYAWNSSVVIGLFVGAGVTTIVFAGWLKYRGDAALLPLKLLKNRTAVLAVLAAFFGDGGFQSIVFYLPIWFQAVLGVSPIQSGVRYLPAVIADLLTSVIGGGIVMALGTYKPFHLLGAALLSIGGGLFTTLYPTINDGRWIGYEIICGVGFSFLVTMPQIAVQTVLPPDLIPVAISTVMFGMILGCTICIAVAQTIFVNILRENLSHVVTPSQESQILNAGASKLQSVIQQDGLNATAVDNAYSDAVTKTFYIPAAGAACAFLLILGMEWTNFKKKKPDTSPEKGEVGDAETSPDSGPAVDNEPVSQPTQVSKLKSVLAKLKLSTAR